MPKRERAGGRYASNGRKGVTSPAKRGNSVRMLRAPLFAIEVAVWGPILVLGLVAGCYLVVAGQPSRAQRALGIVLLVLAPIAAYMLSVWFEDGCFEGYEAANCGYSGAGWLLSLAVLVAVAGTALLALYKLIRFFIGRRTGDRPSSSI